MVFFFFVKQKAAYELRISDGSSDVCSSDLVSGTGATGVQAITEIAKTAEHLTVFQRRPNWCKPLHNRPISKEEMGELRAWYPEMFRLCQQTASCFLPTPDHRRPFDLTPEDRKRTRLNSSH